MNVGQLRNLLEGKPDYLEVVLAKSYEGEVGSILQEASVAKYIPCDDVDYQGIGTLNDCNSRTQNCLVLIPKV